MSLIDRTKDQVFALIDEGKLRWAWDISLERERTRRRLLRVLPVCVDEFLDGRECQLEFEDVAALLLPQSDRPLLAVDVYRALNVSETFLYMFIRRKELEAVSGWGQGRCGSAQVSRESVVRFLRRRAYPFPEGEG
jgi:hypothetical protein